VVEAVDRVTRGQVLLPNLTVLGTAEGGRQVAVALPLVSAWKLMEAIPALGGTEPTLKFAQTILFFDRKVMGYPPDIPAPKDPYALDNITSDNVELLIKRLDAYSPKADTEEERLISFCYLLLRERHTNRPGVARFASEVLGREIKTNTWTQRVNRWARDRRLPKIELRKRKE